MQTALTRRAALVAGASAIVAAGVSVPALATRQALGPNDRRIFRAARRYRQIGTPLVKARDALDRAEEEARAAGPPLPHVIRQHFGDRRLAPADWELETRFRDDPVMLARARTMMRRWEKGMKPIDMRHGVDRLGARVETLERREKFLERVLLDTRPDSAAGALAKVRALADEYGLARFEERLRQRGAASVGDRHAGLLDADDLDLPEKVIPALYHDLAHLAGGVPA